MHSVILTIHNKEFLADFLLERIYNYTVGEYELIVVLDDCTDDSEQIVLRAKNNRTKVIYTDNVFETKANNAGLKIAQGDYCIIVQDDMLITEYKWNTLLEQPFNKFDDVFAVSARNACNMVINENSQHRYMEENLDNCWSDIFSFVNVIGATHNGIEISDIDRSKFSIRSVVNRGPLMINHADLEKLNYLDENFAPQDLDDADLCFRSKELGKVVGCYCIGWESDLLWGGTRINGQTASWLFKANHKNAKLLLNKHGDIMKHNVIEERPM
jgi:glycosyltransferase involved in cell wall biosynthesis